MKFQIDVSEEESALLVELLERDQQRLDAERGRAQSLEGDERLRRQLEVTQKTVDVLSREPSQVWCEELLDWSLPL
jgi:hypothetical protein